MSQHLVQFEVNPRPHGVEKLEATQIRDEVLVVVVVKLGNRKDVYRGLK